MLVQCQKCGWRYLRHRAAVHQALHSLLPTWPCPVAVDVGVDVLHQQFPLDLIAILLHGLYLLQPTRQVFKLFTMLSFPYDREAVYAHYDLLFLISHNFPSYSRIQICISSATLSTSTSGLASMSLPTVWTLSSAYFVTVSKCPTSWPSATSSATGPSTSSFVDCGIKTFIHFRFNSFPPNIFLRAFALNSSPG